MKTFIFVTLLFFCALSEKASAAGYIVRFGPTSLGNGGPNPLGLPPGGSDVEFSLVTVKGFELNVGLPGLLCGYRAFTKWGGYVSAGGGIALDANGVGPAGYTAFGYDFGWDTFKFNLEYKQAVGISSAALISPYAVRFGFGLWFK